MPTPSHAELLAAHSAAEAAPIDLATQLKDTQAALWRERTLRRIPRLEPVIGLVSGDTEDAYAARADELDEACAAASAAYRKR